VNRDATTAHSPPDHLPESNDQTPAADELASVDTQDARVQKNPIQRMQFEIFPTLAVNALSRSPNLDLNHLKD